MMQREKLEAAVEEGLLNQEQLEPLWEFINEEPEPEHGEEQLHFIRSFGDIFITIGIIFASLSAFFMTHESWSMAFPLLIVIAVTEWLVRQRRLALPGIALLIAILFYSGALTVYFAEMNGLEEGAILLLLSFNLPLIALAYYWRYRVPFSLIPAVAGVLFFISVLLGINPFDNALYFIAFGLIVLAIAIVFDVQDRERQTRLSDSAFWLHLLAAPLLVHGVMISLISYFEGSHFAELLMLIFFILFFLIALLLDRRALLVSSFSYAIYAIVHIAEQQQFEFENLTLLVFMVVGISIVIFGTYWYKLRNLLFARLENQAIANLVPSFK